MNSQENPIRVIPGPANYFSHTGSLSRLKAFFTDDQLDHAFWLYGHRAFAATQTFLPDGILSDNTVQVEFDGHCSETEVARLKRLAGDDRTVIIGVGGGRVQDTAKALARRLQLPFVAIPTIAATCAAWTPLSVWYDDQHQALGYEIFPDANYMVLVEPDIILQAPREYLLAGIGDTLAKWYEADVISPEPADIPLTAQLGLDTARAIRDVLIEQSETALSEQQQGQAGRAFINIIDAIIAGGGLVGGLGDRYTRIAAAHAIHNGLTVLPQTNRFLHGTKVAYGILVQTALLGQIETLHQLIDAFQRFDLPVSLAQLDVDITHQADMDAFIQHTLRPIESIHLLPKPVTPETLRAAIEVVERLAHQLN